MSFETFPADQPSALGNFVLGTSILGYSVTGTLTDIIPAYLYQQYADDPDLQAFFSSLNTLAQGYLDWFNQTPLSVYTDDSISGLLLDWIGQNLYGYERPVVSTTNSTISGFYGSAIYGLSVYGTLTVTQSGTSYVADDDVYKRALTWNLYAGDGYQMSIPWLKRRIARFLYGTNGGDISLDDLLDVSIGFTSTKVQQAYGMQVYGESVYADSTSATINPQINITIPNLAISETFKVLFESGVLPIPFQPNFVVTIL